MKRRLAVWLLLVVAAPLVSVGQEPPAKEKTWAERLAEVTRRPEYQFARWGILVVDSESGTVLYEENPDQLFVPASTTKLFSVAAALEELGPDFIFQTAVRRRGEIGSDGSLTGDLILVASGDPTLGGRTGKYGQILFQNVDHTYANGNDDAQLTESDPLAGLKELARQVAAAGIKAVQGEVLIDDRLFSVAPGTGSGPQRLTPIMVNDNVLDLVITPTVEGQPAQVTWRPQTQSLSLDIDVRTVAAGLRAVVQADNVGPGRIVVRGQIPARHKPVVRILEVPDPASFARSLFIESLRAAGVRVVASPLAVNRSDALPPREEVAKLPLVAEFRSLPFREHAKLILKVSHNLHAGTLPLLLAARTGGQTLEVGLRRQGAILARMGLDLKTFSIGSGAGGSVGDQISPRALVHLLQRMRVHPHAAVFRDALPILGVDGTLAQAVDENSPARGQVQAKTGTFLWRNGLTGRFVVTSKALAGYLRTRSGRERTFAMMVNNTFIDQPADVQREGRALGQLCRILWND